MNITETGYYETRMGDVAYVVGFLPTEIADGLPICGVFKGNEGTWHEESWTTCGLSLLDEEGETDLIRYIGKELPEEKPQPERVELSKLWVIWWKPNDRLCPYSFWKGDVLFDTKEKAKEYFPDTLLSYQKIAITPADATGFTIGENL